MQTKPCHYSLILLTLLLAFGIPMQAQQIQKTWAGQHLKLLLKQSQTTGHVTMGQDKGKEVILIRGDSTNNLAKLTLPLLNPCLNRFFMLTVEAKSNSSDAQIMLSEGFQWGSSQKVRRFIRKRLPGDEEYAVYQIPFHVQAVPFYVNCGILWNASASMTVLRLGIRELTATEFKRQKPVTSDDMRYQEDSGQLEILQAARQRLLSSTRNIMGNTRLPAQLRRHAQDIHDSIRTLKLRQNDALLKQAAQVIGHAEQIVVFQGKRMNPRISALTDGTIRLTLYQCHCPYSVWFRLEASSPGAVFKLIAPDGKTCPLNEADLLNLPAGEPMEVEISQLPPDSSISFLPLDHCGPNSRKTLAFKPDKH